jgi:hypothetical protein
VTVVVNEELLTHALAADDESRGAEGSKAGNGADHALAGNMDASKTPLLTRGLDDERAWRAAGHSAKGSSADDCSQKRATALDLSTDHDGAAG